MNSRCLKLLSSKKFKKGICIALLIKFFFLCVAIFRTDWFCTLYPKEDISCHYVLLEDDLPTFEDLSSAVTIFQFLGYEKKDQRRKEDSSRRNIFFHETSCKGDLTARQACAIESAARAHPHWTVNVLFSSGVSRRAARAHGVLRRLLLPNVKYARVRLPEYVFRTPLEHLVIEGKLNGSSYLHSHTSDVLRYTTLYKYPGVYLDLDVIVTRSVEQLPGSFVVRESDYAVAAAVLAFDDDEVGRSIARAVAWEMKETFRGDEFGHNGPGAITRVLARRCGSDDPRTMSADTCHGLAVYGPELAYPVPWREARTYFREGILDPQPAAHIYHVWGRFSRCYSVERGSPYQALARKYCPMIYKAFPEEFGW